MSQEREQQTAALQSSQRSVSQIEGAGDPKIGVEEFMSLAERFGFSAATMDRLRAAVAAENWGEGPFLANYHSGLAETKVQAFERVARETFGAAFAIGVSSGTGALHSAFVAVGVGPGAEVICPAIGFYATAAAVVMAGGVPVFCDVDESLGMDPSQIESHITSRTVALAPTHVMGSVCDMESIMAVARRHDLKVVEDCAQSCGGTQHGRFVGTFGDIGCFSISAYKIVGGGEGGLIITDEERLWDRASCLCEGGGLWRPDRFAPPRYEGELFVGTNYRMSELEAAVDVVQLANMPQTVGRFRAVKQQITRRLETFREIRPQLLNDPSGEIGYNLRFFPDTIELGERLVADLQAEDLAAGIRGRNASPDWHIYHSMFPITLKTSATPEGSPWGGPVYAQRGGSVEYARGDCPMADDLFDRMVNIRLNQWYTEDDCATIAAAVNRVLVRHCTTDTGGRPWA